MADLQLLSGVLSDCCNDKKKFISYDGKDLRFKPTDEQKGTLEKELKEYKVPYQVFASGNEFVVPLNVKVEFATLFFYDEKTYLTHIKSLEDEFDGLNIVILKFEGNVLIKETSEKFTEKKAIFFNAIQYRSLIKLIGQTTDFTSFWDKDNQRLLIFSGDKGPFFIGYDELESKIKMLPDLLPQREALETAFTKIDFIQFFKDAVIEGVHTSPEEQRFFEMIKSLQVLIDIATRDHTLYLRKFGFDKIKARFKEERIKYFESIEKNIESVSKQVTSFPLTFAASVFAGYQVKDKSLILFLILGAYLLYTVIAWKILDVVAFNRKKIDEDVTTEQNNIQTGYQMIYDTFKPDFDKIRDKIRRLKNLICLLRIVLIALLLGFGVFCWYQYHHPNVPGKIPPVEVRIVP